MTTQAFMPARAAWAETLLARLPVEAQARVSNSNSRATLVATETTRSLNDHVGFWQSFLTYRRFRPNARPRLPARSSGVYPVPMSTAVSARQGSRSAYRHIVGGPLSIRSRVRTRRSV